MTDDDPENPPPIRRPCAIASAVAADIERRASFGVVKYGVTVEDSPLSRRQWEQHLYEELIDAAVYLKKQMMMGLTMGTHDTLETVRARLANGMTISDGDVHELVEEVDRPDRRTP